MSIYIFFSFAPVQSFIEKSRKLRDLYGASRLLSYLSKEVVDTIDSDRKLTLISPALIKVQETSDRRGGMPNRILCKGELTEEEASEAIATLESAFLKAWNGVLVTCREWIEKILNEKLPSYYPEGTWQWEAQWKHCANYAWELFWGMGGSIPEAIADLETRKLSRAWTAMNWVGESSSLAGIDGIACPKSGWDGHKPKEIDWGQEMKEIGTFYSDLAFLLDDPKREDDWRNDPKKPLEGKYVDAKEHLSIPELTKRLFAFDEITNKFNIKPLGSFKDLADVRKTNNSEDNQWTGWFMGDGDKAGDYLTRLADEPDGDDRITEFSRVMRSWGERFVEGFPKDFGRVVYAGGDDFLGVVYNPNDTQSISGAKILKWLRDLRQKWEEGEDKTPEIKAAVTLSVGFVWAAPGVPQRDVLQHCREAERRSKQQGRDRVTIRIVFSNGRYLQWTCPWQYLDMLDRYKDLEGGSNWSHVYSDLARLESRRGFGWARGNEEIGFNDDALDNEEAALEFFELYFPDQKQRLLDNAAVIFKQAESAEKSEEARARAILTWVRDLIGVGWHLCGDMEAVG